MKAVECRNLTKTFGRANALDRLSFSIEANTITGLIGRNGVGKTTLLKIIAGFLKETSGEVNVFSNYPFNNLFVSANTIFVDDRMNLPQNLKLKEILEEAGSFYQNWDHELAQRLFDYFSLHPDQRHDYLSKGKQSTFNMILGLCSRCALTLFDEPTTGMDESVRKDFYRALLKDYLAHPRTILLSSHYLNEIEDLLEDVLLLKDGEVAMHTSISDLKEYAVGLKGPITFVSKWTQRNTVLHKEELGTGSQYAVIENHFDQAELNLMKTEGITVSPVAASDVCVYLTSKEKGGIDDVFSPSEPS